MDVDTTPGELEESPRDSVHSVPSFEVHDVNRWTRHSEALFEELRLPLDTMDRLERDPDAVLVAIESAQERLDSLRERRDEPISVESQLVETNAEVGGSNLAAMNDPEEERLQNNLRALRGRPSYFTPVTPMEEVRSGNYSEDEPSFSRTFQQAVTGMDLVTLDPEQTPSRVSGRSQEGMIPVTTPNPTQLAPSESFGLPEPSLLSRNLLSILQRPSFIDSPIPRWTAPPQWLQFQVLRTYEEGLMIDENQNSTNANAYATYTEDTRTQVETNLQGLLQARVDDDFISAPPQRWQQPEQWLQASLGYDVVARPPVRFDAAFDDGLITAPPRVNDPASTPTVTCSFGLMQQIGFGERKLEFYPETFNAMDAPFFANRVRSQASNTTDLMFLIITDWQPWFKNALQDALPDFPIQTLQHFTSPQVSSMLPSIDYNEGELTCIMEHINTHRKPQVKFANEREIDVGTAKAQCLPLVVWTRAQGAIEAQPERPLIVVIGKRTDKISSKIISHYANDRYKRWDRLTKNQAWVYLDLYFLFTKWDRIWAAVKRNQQKRTEEVHARQNVMPILQQTRQLHKDNNIMISLREHVRIHKASLKIVMQRVEYMLGGVDFMTTQGLKGRLDDAYQLLEYYEVTATTLLEQQQNLLSLAFNLETVAQGAAVARLNALAFVFLPLSFVASVFGITTFTAPPKWYPVAAVPVLLATVLVAYAANQFFTSRTMKESVVEVEEPLMPTSDLEKIPTRNSVAPVPIWQSVKMIWRRRTGSVTRSEKELPGTWAAKSTGINDPSRLLRRSTDRSLAARSYVPPRSTVQFIPGAFDYFSAGPSSYSAPSSQIPGSHSYDFAPGSSAMYDDPYSQVSQMSSSYSPIQSYQHYTEVAEAYGTPQHPSELGASLSARPSGTPVIPRLPIDDSEAVDADDLYTAGDELGVRTARAIFDFEATGSEDLSFKAGDILRLLPRTSRYEGWANARIGTKFGVVPLEFLEVIDPLQGGVSTTSTSDVANSHNKEISTSETGYFDPPAAFSQDGDDRGYRRDGPAFFGLPPDGFSSLFSGSTLEDPTSNSSSIPASRRFGTIFGGLDEVMMRETSANTRLEPIPEEGSIIADSV